MEEFLEKYNFIEFTEEHYLFLEKMLYDSEQGTHGSRPCDTSNCFKCPFFQDNNRLDAWCGQYPDSAMVGFAGRALSEIVEIIEEVKEDYENLVGFWRVK